MIVIPLFLSCTLSRPTVKVQRLRLRYASDEVSRSAKKWKAAHAAFHTHVCIASVISIFDAAGPGHLLDKLFPNSDVLLEALNPCCLVLVVDGSSCGGGNTQTNRGLDKVELTSLAVSNPGHPRYCPQTDTLPQRLCAICSSLRGFATRLTVYIDWREVPLLTALSYGISSVEADVWLFEGDLLVRIPSPRWRPKPVFTGKRSFRLGMTLNRLRLIGPLTRSTYSHYSRFSLPRTRIRYTPEQHLNASSKQLLNLSQSLHT